MKNQIAKRNNGWIESFFVYRINDEGERYTLRYFKNELTAEKRCYCKDVYESFGQIQSTFTRNFHYAFLHNEIRAEGTNNRSMMCSFKDALTYVLDQYDDLQHAFNERGVKAIEAGVDGDIIGMIASFADTSREQASKIVMNTSHVIMAALPGKERRLYIEQLNEFADELDRRDEENALLSAERDKAIEAREDQIQRHIKSLRPALKERIYNLNWNTMTTLLGKGMKFERNSDIKPTWNSKTGTVNVYNQAAEKIFEPYFEDNTSYWQLAYLPGKKREAEDYCYALWQEYIAKKANENPPTLFGFEE